MSGLLEPIPWETRNLGLPSYAVTPSSEQGAEALKRELAVAAEQGPIFVQAKVAGDQTLTSSILSRCGFYFVETALSPHANLRRHELLDAFDRSPASALHGRYEVDDMTFETVTEDNAAARKAIREIAGCAFREDRFHFDINCDNAIADRRYQLWVDQMFEQGDTFYALSVESQVAGFMVRRNDTFPLAGFAPAYARSGLGDYLWLASMSAMRQAGCTRVRTGISANNTGVLNLYARLGFRFREPTAVFHYWSKATASREDVTA